MALCRKHKLSIQLLGIEHAVVDYVIVAKEGGTMLLVVLWLGGLVGYGHAKPDPKERFPREFIKLLEAGGWACLSSPHLHLRAKGRARRQLALRVGLPML